MTSLPSRREPGAPPVLEPHTVASGVPLEDYTWVSQVQSYPRHGPYLPWEGWYLLPEALKHRLTRGPFNPARARHLAVLTDHGLLENGRLTLAGREIAEVLAVAGPRLTVQAWSTGERCHALDVLIAGPTAAILSTPTPLGLPGPEVQGSEVQGSEVQDNGSLLALELVDVTWVPAAIAAWTGTAPAWTFSVAPTTVDYDGLMRRLRGEPVPPPPGADEHLLDVWEQPWWLWRLETSGTAQPLTVLHAGRRGCYQVGTGPRQGTATLVPTPSGVVWEALLGVVHATITPAPPP